MARSEMDDAYCTLEALEADQSGSREPRSDPLLDRPNDTRSLRTSAHQEKNPPKRKSVTIITNHCYSSNQNHHRARPIFRRSIGAVVPRKSEVAGAGWRGNNVTDSGCKVGRVAGRRGNRAEPTSVPGLVLMRTRRVKADAKLPPCHFEFCCLLSSGQR